MPKTGAEASRKAALVDAAIAAVGRSGTQDVPVAGIAREAGMSPALAHHYFGSKSQMLVAAMRHILSVYGAGVRTALAGAAPGQRAEAIIAASLDGIRSARAQLEAIAATAMELGTYTVDGAPGPAPLVRVTRDQRA